MKKLMQNKEKRIGLIVSGLVVLAYLGLLALRFDFWYDLNDDVMIQNITSGVYTGTPEAHNIQMQYPLSWLLSLLYRISNQIPWYAIFLVGIQAICLILILFRTSEMIQNKRLKTGMFLTATAILFLLLEEHMLLYQYTVTCSFLSASAVFLLLTGSGFKDKSAVAKKAWKGSLTKKNITVVLLLLLAFLIRSEMMLLTFPMVMVSFLFCVIYACPTDIGIDKKAYIIESFKKYLMVFITIVIGIFAAALIHYLAYSSSEWKAFIRLFNARTELYDFRSIPSFEEHQAFYSEEGVGEAAQKLLENYNYGLNNEVDAELLWDTAQYAKSVSEEAGAGQPGELQKALQTYYYHLRHPFAGCENGTDYLWKLTIMVAYVLVFIVGRGHYILWKELLLFACRSTLWLYILIRNRVPVRISHSLYFVELAVLMALLFLEYKHRFQKAEKGRAYSRKAERISLVIYISIVIICILLFPRTDQICKNKEAEHMSASKSFDILFAYMAEHPSNFYFMDVYSWVPYTEKLFTKNVFKTNVIDHAEVSSKNLGGSSYEMNYDIMGGWVTFSPLYTNKLQARGQSSMQVALLSEQVFYVQKSGMDFSWLQSFYRENGTRVAIEHVDTVGEFDIFKLISQDDEVAN